MKKFLKLLVCALFCLCLAVGFGACSQKEKEEDLTRVSVYAPDGAPALALSKLMSEEMGFGKSVSYNIVSANAIQTYVTGNKPVADVCILPVNAAVKLLGDASTYKMLGTVTHGNLYLLKKQGGEDIDAENLQTLVGKTVGIINLAAVPGLTFKFILDRSNIPFNDLSSSGEADAEKVNLKGLSSGTDVTPADAACDYFVVAEPIATTKVTATAGKLDFAGDLQALYGSENGYPQAVIVAKKSLIESDEAFIRDFLSAVTENAEWILSDNASPTDIVNAIIAHLPADYAPMFTDSNLTKQVIENCGIRFVSAADCREEVNGFIEALNKVSASPWGEAADAFFCSL